MADLNRLADLILPGIRNAQLKLKEVSNYLGVMPDSLRRYNGWQAIETAPKDGSVVLIFDPSREKWKINSAYWPNHWDKPCFLSAGQGIMLDKATHWMPLPEPPK